MTAPSNDDADREWRERSKKYYHFSKYMPKYYRLKYDKMSSLPSPGSPLQTGFVNRQQRMFYLLMTSFKVAKILAILVIALLIIGWL
jgi:hypothetical protein